MYRNQAHHDKRMDRHRREITNHLKVAKNVAIKILSVISLLFSGFPSPGYALTKPSEYILIYQKV